MGGPPKIFSRPDFSAPLDVEACLRAAPSTLGIKGVFSQGVLSMVKAAGKSLPRGPYTAFRTYPITEHMGLIVDAARLLHPTAPLREGIRRLGAYAYPSFLETMIGKAIFGAFLSNVEMVLKLVPRAYAVAFTSGSIEPLEVRPGFARLLLRGCYCFLDSYYVGGIEGILSSTGSPGEVKLWLESPSSGEMECRW